MAVTNTFLEFLQNNNKCSDGIYNSIYDFCNHHKQLLCDKCDGYDVYRVVDVEDINLEYKQVWIDDNPGSIIDFDIAIEVSAEVEGVSGKHHDHDSYTSTLWVLLSCRGDLAKRLKDFTVIRVDEFDSRSKPKKPLSGDMVPIIKGEDYDKYANEILLKFYPEALSNNNGIDVELLAKRMGFTIKEACISNDGSVFGKFFFNKTKAMLYDREGKCHEEEVEKDTILIDTKATYFYSYGCRALTIAHEIVHGYFHKKAFLFAQLFDDELSSIGCKVNGGTLGKESGPIFWMEKHANGIAPCLLMPKESFDKAAKSIVKNYLEAYNDNIVDLLPLIIHDLADRFGITVFSAKKRLIDIGIWEAAGACNWVDGSYARPFHFAKGSLGPNETFTISSGSFNVGLLFNSSYMQDVYLGKYEFVENHVVLNDPAYIEKDNNGNIRLTEFARMHLDQCALKFRCKQVGNYYDNSIGAICYLCRDVSKYVEFDLEITKNPNIVFTDSGIEKHNAHQKSVNEIYSCICTMKFPEIIEWMMDYLDINENELADLSGLDTRTIRRYINGENRQPNKKTVVAIIRAFDVPARVSDVMVKKAGISFVEGDVIDDALVAVLTSFRESSVEDVDRFFLLKTGERLTKEKF